MRGVPWMHPPAPVTPHSMTSTTTPGHVSGRTLAVVTAGALLTGAVAGLLLHARHVLRDPFSLHDAPPPPPDPVSYSRDLITSDLDRRRRRAHCKEEVAVTLRPAREDDIPALAAQWFTSYNSSAAALKEPPVFPSPESATSLVTSYVKGKVGLLACDAHTGEILASAFNDESDIGNEGNVIGGGPWTVTWSVASQGVGRTLLSALLSQSLSRGARSIRLLQGGNNLASFALYTKLGCEIREPLVFLAGALDEEVVERTLTKEQARGWSVREMTAETPESVRAQCAALWQRVTGCSRAATLQGILQDDTRRTKKVAVFEQGANGECVAFSTGFGSMTSSAAVSSDAMKYLLCASARLHSQSGAHAGVVPALHLCSRRDGELVRWALAAGMRVLRSSNLMVLGGWQPIGLGLVYCPSTELN